MANIKPPKQFRLVGPWLKYQYGKPVGGYFASKRPEIAICAERLAWVCKRTKGARQIQFTLTAVRRWRAYKIQFERSVWDSWWWRTRHDSGGLYSGTRKYLSRKFRNLKIKPGDTITLWLSVEVK